MTRYVTPLREGGSLPAIVEADDDGLYVLKFRGAGQGPDALIAEVIAGGIARAIDLPVPEIVLADLDPELARTEPDPEIHALLLDSAGINVALDYLPGSVAFDPLLHAVDPDLASRIVWFDAYISNIDRTARNTNMLLWHRRVWLIDHGAALYVHHQPGWEQDDARARHPFPLIASHVLLARASRLEAVDDPLAARLEGSGELERIVDSVPATWLAGRDGARDVPALRRAYVRYLHQRLAGPREFVEEARRAR